MTATVTDATAQMGAALAANLRRESDVSLTALVSRSSGDPLDAAAVLATLAAGGLVEVFASVLGDRVRLTPAGRERLLGGAAPLSDRPTPARGEMHGPLPPAASAGDLFLSLMRWSDQPLHQLAKRNGGSSMGVLLALLELRAAGLIHAVRTTSDVRVRLTPAGLEHARALRAAEGPSLG